jgi:plastocyanin
MVVAGARWRPPSVFDIGLRAIGFVDPTLSLFLGSPPRRSPHVFRRTFAWIAAGALLASGTLSTPAMADDWGDLKVQVVLGGDVPELKPIEPTADKGYCGTSPIPNEALVVDGESKGIGNFMIYLYLGRGAKAPPIHPDLAKVDETPVELANQSCYFQPHTLFLQVGQTLKVSNPDDVGHNANLQFVKNKAQNFQIPSKGEEMVKIEKAEPAPIEVACNAHPWMKARMLVLDHPYGGISSADGTITIAKLPVGKHKFRIYHESFDGAVKEIVLGGNKVAPEKNQIEVEIKAGENDLGKLEIGVKSFKLP